MWSAAFLKKSGFRNCLCSTNELYSELPPKRIAQSVIDVAKNTQSDNRIVSIVCIVSRNDNFNIKVMEDNKKPSKICDKKNCFF